MDVMGIARHLPLLLLLLFDTGGPASGVGLLYPCADTLDVVFVAEVRGESLQDARNNWFLTRAFIVSFTERLMAGVRSLRVSQVVYGDTLLMHFTLKEDLDEALMTINETDFYQQGTVSSAAALLKVKKVIDDDSPLENGRQAVIVLIAGQDVEDLRRQETLEAAALVKHRATIVAVGSYKASEDLVKITGSDELVLNKRGSTLHETLRFGLDTSLAVLCGIAQDRAKCGSQVDVIFIGQDTSGYVQDVTTWLSTRVDDVQIAPIIRGDGKYDPQSSFTTDENLISSYLEDAGDRSVEVDLNVALNNAVTLIEKEASTHRSISILILAASELEITEDSLKMAVKARGLANIVVFSPTTGNDNGEYSARLVDITHDRSRVVLYNLKYDAFVNYTARLLCHEEVEQQTDAPTDAPGRPEMTLSKDELHMGEDSTATITVMNVPGVSRPTTEWKLNGLLARNGSRITITPHYDADSAVFTSTLSLQRVSYKDDGNISCTVEAEGWSDPVTETKLLSVLGHPSVTISNITASVPEGGSITLQCTASVRKTSHPDSNQPVLFTWFGASPHSTSQNTTHDDGAYYIYTDSIIHSPTETGVYTCQAKNDAGQSQAQSCRVTVIKEGTTTCPAELARDISWPTTLVNDWSKFPCSEEYTGDVSRRCDQDGGWEEPDYSECVPVVYEEMKDEVTDMIDGRGASPERTQEVAETLKASTTQNLTKPRELEESVKIVSDLATVHEDLKEPPSHKEVEDVFDVINTLFKPENEKLWKATTEKEKTEKEEKAPVSGVNIMDSVDKYAEALTKGDLGCKGNMRRTNFTKDNLVMALESRCNTSTPAKYQSQLDTMNEITIPADTLNQIAAGAEELLITVINYKSLDAILPTTTTKSNFQNTTIASRVQSISIKSPNPITNLKEPILLFFETVEAMDDRKPFCSAWDRSADGEWSTNGCEVRSHNSSGTLCACNHMTNFAVLFAHYVDNVHHKVLSYMTIVGCTISIICMLITMITYCALWKFLKMVFRGNMFRAYMLINLCCVLCAVNLIFMAGVEQTSINTVCVAIAAILHYLFLVAFTTMLVTSLNLLYKLVQMSKGASGDTKKDLIIGMALSWGVPLLIVAIALGATQGADNYRDKNFCWLSKPDTIWAFVAPVIIVIVVNILILIKVLWFKISSMISSIRRTNVNNEESIVRSALWAFAVLGPIVGFTWILGVMMVNSTDTVMEYLFVIFNSTQGIFIFLFHCAMDKNVRKAFNNYRNDPASLLSKTKTSWLTSQTGKSSTSEDDTSALKRTTDESIEVPSRTDVTFKSRSENVDLKKDHPFRSTN